MALTQILEDIGAIGPASNPFGPPSVGKWNLQRGIFTNTRSQSMVFFFSDPKDESGVTSAETKNNLTGVESMSDSGGRRLAIYEYPYLDGQEVVDLGRKAETFSLNITFWGLNYQKRMEDFLRFIGREGGPGSLTHPIRGTIKACFREYEFVHSYNQWNAVTIKATFVETENIQGTKNQTEITPNSKIRTALQALISNQGFISEKIFEVQALLLLPSAVAASMQLKLSSITNQFSRLVAALGVTFSSDQTTQLILSQTIPLIGGITTATSGTVNQTTSSGQGSLAQLPPVFQTGFDPVTNAKIKENLDTFVSANQITPQKAVFQANQTRQSITAAINEINDQFGNDGYDIVIKYRTLSVNVQEVVEASIAFSQTKIKKFVVNNPMSLRVVAKLAGLTPDRQNEIEQLNPYLSSVNYIPAGTVVTVPIA